VKNLFNHLGANWVMKGQSVTRCRSLSVGTNNGDIMTRFGKRVGEGANP
jgi:hypothetical protein